MNTAHTSSPARRVALLLGAALAVAAIALATHGAAPAHASGCTTDAGPDNCGTLCVSLVMPVGRTPGPSPLTFNSCSDYWDWWFAYGLPARDNPPPSPPTITGGPANGSTVGPDVTFTLSTSDVNVTGYDCQLDGGAWTPCTSPAAYPGLAPGRHTFAARERNANGTGPSSAPVTWTTGIAVAITGGPSGTVSSRAAQFTFGSSDDAATYTCQIDGGAASGCTSPVSYGGLPDGRHTFTVNATHGAQQGQASSSWTIDTSAPRTTITSKPDGQTEATYASFGFASSKPGSSFVCSLDGGAPKGCSSPAIYTDLKPGAHRFAVAAVDALGNRDPAGASYAWTVAAPGTTCSVPRARSGRHAKLFGSCAAPPTGNCAKPAQAIVGVDAFVGQAADDRACFHLVDGEWRSSGGDVYLNGLELQLPRGGALVIDKRSGHVYTTVAPRVKIGPWWVPSPLPWGFRPSKAATSFQADGLVSQKSLALPKLRGLRLAVTSFEFEGARQAQVNGHGGAVRIGVRLELPKAFSIPGIGIEGVGMTGELLASNGAGVQGTISFHAKRFWLEGQFELEDVTLAYDSFNDHAYGQATGRLGSHGPGLKVSLGWTPAGLTVGLGLEDLNEPIGDTGAFLQKLGGEFGVNTNLGQPQNRTIAVSGEVSAGPHFDIAGFKGEAASVAGKLTFGLPTRTASGYVELDGVGKLMGLQVANGQLVVHDANGARVDFSGGINLSNFGLNGDSVEVPLGDGWITAHDFLLAGYLRGTLPIGWLPVRPSVNDQVLFSRRAVGQCVQVLGVSVGWSFVWAGRHLSLYGNNCDIGRLQSQASGSKVARAAGSGSSVTLRGGMRVAALAIRGVGAAPKVTVTGPGGVRFSTPATGTGATGTGYSLYEDAATDTTSILLLRPRAGTWTVTPQPGSAPIAAVQHADQLPPVRVKARVAGRGRARTLTFSAGRIAGQRVTFVETGRGVAHVLRSTSAAHGRIRFVPAAAPARARQILALVEQDGRLRTRLTVARFRAPAPPASRAPRRLRVTRRGRTLRVTWAPAAGAAGYIVAVRLGSAPTTVLTPGPRARSVRAPAAPSAAGLVQVSTLSSTGAASRPARVRVRAVRKVVRRRPARRRH